MATRFFVPADMQAIARYERTFGFEEHEITLDALRKQFADYTFQASYQMTLDDLKTAVENIQRKNPTVYDMIYAWWYPLYHLAPFGILEACGFDPTTKKERPDRVRGLIVDACDVFYNVWTILGDMPQEDYKTPVALEEDLAIALEVIRWYTEEKELPVEKRSFSYWDKTGFLRQFEKSAWLEAANERELTLGRTFVRELCAEGSETALALMADSCRIGNRLYAKNPAVARTCYERLWQLTGKTEYQEAAKALS